MPIGAVLVGPDGKVLAEEGNRTIQLAREKSDQLVERDVIVQAANARAEQIIGKAREEADGVRREADQYVFDSLSRLYRELDRIMNQVHNGIVMVEKELMEPKAAPTVSTTVDEVPRQALGGSEDGPGESSPQELSSLEDEIEENPASGLSS